MGIIGASEAGIALIVERTVRDAQVADEGPDLGVVPVDDGVDADEIGPAVVGRVEMGQLGTVRVRPARAHEDGLDGRVEGEIGLEGGPQGGPGRVGGVPRQ